MDLSRNNCGQQSETSAASTDNQRNNCPCPFGGMEKPGSAGNPTAFVESGSVGMSRPSLISSLWSIQVQNEGSASDFPMAGCGSQQSLPEMLTQVNASSTLPFGGYHQHQHCNGFTGAGGQSACAGGIQSTAPCTVARADGIVDQIQGSTEMISGCGGPHQMDLQTGTANIGQQPGNQFSLRPVKSLSDLRTLTAAQIAQTAAVMPCPHHFHQQQSAAIQPNDQSYLGFRRQTDTGPYYTTMLSRQQRDSQICEWLQKLNMNGGGSTVAGGSESPSQEFYQQQRPPFLRADTTEQ